MRLKRFKYRGYIADTDINGNPYIYNTKSPYSEDSDRLFVYLDYTGGGLFKQIKKIIDRRVEENVDARWFRYGFNGDSYAIF